MPNIVLIDPHEMILESLTLFLESTGGCNVVFSSSNGSEALLYLEANPDKVDLVITDIEIAGKNGLQLLKEIKNRYPFIKVMILTSSSGEYYVTKSIALGVNGYVLKSCEEVVLLEAIDQMMRGELFLSEKVNKVYIQYSKKKAINLHLTEREKGIIKLISMGKTNVEIARMLNLSKHTIAHHRKSIGDKLGISTIAELTIYAVRTGLLLFENGADQG